jgi:hypothetical protein
VLFLKKCIGGIEVLLEKEFARELKKRSLVHQLKGMSFEDLMELYQQLYIEFMLQDNLNAHFLGKLPACFTQYGHVTEEQAIAFKAFQMDLQRLPQTEETRKVLETNCVDAKLVNDSRFEMFQTMQKELGELNKLVEEFL